MPVPLQRDAGTTSERLAVWFAARLPDATDVAVSGLDVPTGSGFTNETLTIRPTWRDAQGAARTHVAILRVAPTRHQVHPDSRFAAQVRLQRILAADTDLPVPPVLWHEEDPAVLGAPFMIMERVDGRVPADVPSYHRSGWIADLAPTERRALWSAGLGVLARLHALDPAALGLDFLTAGTHGRTCSDNSTTTRATSLSTLPTSRPPPAAPWPGCAPTGRRVGPARLLWGDARLGNLIFQGLSPVAVLDWDMAETGPAESDLAWFLHLDRHLSEGIGVPGSRDCPAARRRSATTSGSPVRGCGTWSTTKCSRRSGSA